MAAQYRAQSVRRRCEGQILPPPKLNEDMAKKSKKKLTLDDEISPAALKRSRRKMAENIAEACEGKWDTNHLLAILYLALPKGMKQYEIAEIIGVRQETISEWKTLPHFLEDVNRVAVILFQETHTIVDRATVRDAIRDPKDFPNIAGEIMKAREMYYKRHALLVDRKEVTGAGGGPIEVAPQIDDDALERIAKDVLNKRRKKK